MIKLREQVNNFVAESVGIEPTRRFRNDSLANCCLNRSANLPNK